MSEYKNKFLTKPLFAGFFKRFTLADQACRLFDFVKAELTDSKELTGSMAQMEFNEFTQCPQHKAFLGIFR